MKSKLIFVITMLLTSWLYSGTVYEDGDDASDWTVSDNRPSGATVSSVDDNGENVIQLQGNGIRNAYLLGDKRASSNAWNNSSDKNITWSMKFDDSFRISVYVKTTRGSRVISYSNKSRNRKRRNRLYYGLGSSYSDGNWHTITRNIESDIQELERGNELLVVYGFMVRGSGLVDDIATISKLTSHQMVVKKTGQTIEYEPHDDGYYQKGLSHNYSRNNEMVTDHVTGLIWQDNEEAKRVSKNWESAKSHCSSLVFGGYSDWRLPSINELLSIRDLGKYNPAINSIFDNVTSSFYWSSTTDASDSSNAWNVYFNYGLDYHSDKGVELYIRCVRGGQ